MDPHPRHSTTTHRLRLCRAWAWCLMVAVVCVGSGLAQDTPGPTEPGPEEVGSPVRARVVLNGLWRFQPATGASERAPGEDWGLMPVPGTWMSEGWSYGNRPPKLRRKGKSDIWRVFGERGDSAPELMRGWYEREIMVPAGWAGRRVLLDFGRVGTDARVWINGRECGEVNWPRGRVDITSAVVAGERATVRVLVVGDAGGGTDVNWMGYATDMATRSKATLETAGLTGEVFLVSEPKGARVSDVFVRTSTRQKAVALDVELEGVTAKGEVKFTARMLAADGTEEKRFEATAPVVAAARQTVTLDWPWEGARLWELGRPQMYTLRLEAEGVGVRDDYPQRFGFREFWIEGRKFFLNGTEIRLRQALMMAESFVMEEIDGILKVMLGRGINILQTSPTDHGKRGTSLSRRLLIAERANELGVPLIGVALAMHRYIQGDKGEVIWNQPGVRDNYRAAMESEMRQYRNHPSILIWGTTGNFFNQNADQYPPMIGQREGFPEFPRTAAGHDGLALIRKADPTRPVFCHAGSQMGDIYTANHYLNFGPLQEREEWMSDHATRGVMPYIGIEFGTPLHTTMMRGREAFGKAVASEPWMTEFCAVYLGNEAYRLETPAYREAVTNRFRSGMQYQSWHGARELEHAPTFQALQAVFVSHTWRSWRTAGVTGGMVPWAMDAQGWAQPAADERPLPFIAGRRGAWPETMDVRRTDYFGTSWKVLPMMKALAENNGPMLAWIAGAPSRFTEKSHSFHAGSSVSKQAVIVNDAREAQLWSAQWRVVVEGTEVASGAQSGELAPASTTFLPITFVADASAPSPRPASSLPGGILSGEIQLDATIGSEPRTDQFPFRIFPRPEPLSERVSVWDPAGHTSKWLTGLGVTVEAWNGRSTGGVLVIGREAYAAGSPPGDVKAFVENGGRALMMAQPVEWFRRQVGLRVSEHVTRRVFPVSDGHPLLRGLVPEDLRDWSGAGTLREAYPKYPLGEYPYAVWRWGNQGSVSSAAIEKPHRSGWRPILEGEFDLAYSPLLELDFGGGRVTLCTLDLDDQVADPVARLLSERILGHVARSPLVPRMETAYVGGAEGERLLRELGVKYQLVKVVPAKPGVLVVGADATLSVNEIEAHAARGGRVLVLAGRKAGSHFGVTLVEARGFAGATNAPAGGAELAGIGLSDLRFRAPRNHAVVADGAEVHAGGLLALRRAGKGCVVYSQLDPAGLDVARLTYFRFTRWRQLRATAQVLANLGVVFDADARIFEPRVDQMPLSGPWQVSLTSPLPVAPWDKPHKDPGISPVAQALAAGETNGVAWSVFGVPAWYPPFDKQSGEAVWRREVELPADWNGHVVQIAAGRIKSFDTVFWNGNPVGSTDAGTPNAWNLPRKYRVPGARVKAGRNVITIRQFAPDRQGGIHGGEHEMFLRVMRPDAAPSFYSSDYREDFAEGDEPYRYYRW